ncbi:MAG: hypothetical protein L6Q95_11685, partial [Planctomycetes bacterium]|nr:hypothetical protein [Planctomycetota bacterium]
FRFADLSPGTYDISSFLPGTAKAQRQVLLGDCDVLDADLTLPPAREFAVVVVDETGAPIPNCMVDVAIDHAASQASMTDAVGRATFFVTGVVTSISAYPESAGCDLARATVAVEGDASEFRVVLKQKATIAGTAYGDDGKPVADALISAKQGGLQVTSAHTAADGSFSLEVPQGESFDLEFVSARGRGGEYTAEPVHAQSGSTGVEIRLRKAARDRTLRVKVVLPDGSPAVGAIVLVDRVRGETDGNGVAVLSGLSARGSPVMAVPPRGRQDLMFAAPQSHVADGQDVTLKLRLAAAVSGVVVMGDGLPGADAVVTFHRDSVMCYMARADPEGRFKAAIPSDEPGPWVVQAELRDKGLKGEVASVMTGDDAVRIVVK